MEPDSFDMHEMNILPGGEAAVILARETKYYSSSSDQDGGESGWVVYKHFHDIAVPSTEVRFHWSTEHHIPLSESYVAPPEGWGAPGVEWDYMLVHLEHSSIIH